MKNQFMLVYCTCPPSQDETAGDAGQNIAKRLIELKLAACVNLIPRVVSVYRWDGEVQCDAEQLLIIKTHEKHLQAVFDRISAMHPYELPELLAVSVDAGSDDYLAWMAEEL